MTENRKHDRKQQRETIFHLTHDNSVFLRFEETVCTKIPKTLHCLLSLIREPLSLRKGNNVAARQLEFGQRVWLQYWLIKIFGFLLVTKYTQHVYAHICHTSCQKLPSRSQQKCPNNFQSFKRPRYIFTKNVAICTTTSYGSQEQLGIPTF